MITAIAASGGVSMPVSMCGMSIASSALDTGPLISSAAQQHAEDDRRHRRALDPAVGDDQLPRRQQLGQDAVLGGRIRGGAEADDRVRERADAA